MKPIREIVVREYLPGYYDVEHNGRVTNCPDRESLYSLLRGEFGRISDPDDLSRIEELKQEIDDLSLCAKEIGI